MASNWNDYRKIPSDARAAQWDGSVGMATELINDVLASEMAVVMRYLCEPNACKHDKDGENSHWLQLDSDGDSMKILPGDYLVQGVEGEFYRIPQGRFEELYEAIPICEHTTYAGTLEPRERCYNHAVLGETLCEDHLHDESDRHDSMRKGE